MHPYRGHRPGMRIRRAHLQTALSAIVFTAASFGSPAAADPIPIAEEFLLATQLHVDLGWDAIIATLYEQEGLLDYGSTLLYRGSYDITEAIDGSFTGSYAGTLAGTWFGELWEILYSSTMFTEAATLNKIWNLESKGRWKRGPFEGKDFKDTGKLTEKTDNTADLDLEIETEGQTEKATVTIRDMKKKKADGKLKVEGDVEIKSPDGEKHKERLSLELDQATKNFVSELKSKSIFTVLKNEGTFTIVEQDAGFSGDISFGLTATPVPEPSAVWLLGAGAIGILVRQARRRATDV
jgi:hypothetical protein